MDPAITIPDKLLPPKKYPGEEVKTVLRRLYHVKNATPPVKTMKDEKVIIKLVSIIYWFNN
jgi:hypothetical protein